MTLFEVLYYSGYRVKTSYDLRRRKRLPGRVISIGNITSGGTGKTPLTMALASEAVRRGLSPVILTRGYGGRSRGPSIIRTEMAAEDAGDEPLLMAERLNGVPVIKGADRYEAGMFALEHLGPFGGQGEKAAQPLFILDDGFQHRRLQRDKDILLVDAQNPFDNRKLLPTGLLREPLGEMKRAGIIVITKGRGSEVTSLRNEITSLNPHASVFVSGHIPAYVKAQGELRPTEWLSGRGVYAFCGIADPDCFRLGLSGLGAQVMGFKTYRDHYRFRQDDVDYIERAAGESGAGWMITTEKDMMRLRPLRLPENLLALGIEVEVEEGFYEEAFDFGAQK